MCKKKLGRVLIPHRICRLARFFGSECSPLPASLSMQEMLVRFLSWKDPLEEGMATLSSILAWEIPWIEETGGLQSMGFQRVGHD